MTILCITRPQVKPTRRTARTARPFGDGIFTRRMPYTLADLDWAAQNLNTDVEPDYDDLAAEAKSQTRLDMGFCL